MRDTTTTTPTTKTMTTLTVATTAGADRDLAFGRCTINGCVQVYS